MLSTQDKKKTIDALLKDRTKRIKLAEQSLAWFTFIYLSHYIKSGVPEFHWEIYRDLQDDELGFLELVAFRGSGKSTIASLALPLWSAIFKKRNFIILLSDTGAQAKQLIANLIFELEGNELLKGDFGTFEGQQEWQAINITLKNNVRISAKSRGQKVRGLRHLQYRPDLIIADDVENIEDVRTKESRDKTEEWLLSDVVPAMDGVAGKFLLIGNLLHYDSLMCRMKEKIKEKNLGVVKEFPLIKDGKVLWPEKFSDKEIQKIRHTVGVRFFKREFLLQIVPSEGQIIKKVNYWDFLPELQRLAIGVDLAISQKETADQTSIDVCAFGIDGNFYNLENNAGRWNFNTTLEAINETYNRYLQKYPALTITLGVEDVAYQKAAIEEITRRYGIPVIPVKQTKDKTARLETIAPLFENEQAFIGRQGQDDLVDQLLGFGIEKYDDRADSFEIALRLLLNYNRPEILWL